MDISYPYICNSQSDIPKEALEHLDGQIVDNIGEVFSEIFPQFSQAFALASSRIEKLWGSPKLVLKKVMREWLSFVVAQSDEKNLFFDLQPEFKEKEGEFFDENHQMLPDGWKELYRWFNSFGVTDKSYFPMDWWNTPFRYEARLDLDSYEEGSGATRKQTEQFAKKIGCKRESLRCWLLTENEDALFIDEEHCDHKVYHVRGKLLDDIYVLPDPLQTLDEYLAHFLSGGKPADFDFRKMR